MSSPAAHVHTPSLAAGAVIDDAERACIVLHHVHRRSPAADIVVLLLGDDRRVIAIVTVDGTGGDPDALVTVVEVMATVERDRTPCDLVVATIRDSPRALPDDPFRWVSASAVAADAGSELIEWFVLADGFAWCPRELVGEPPRW